MQAAFKTANMLLLLGTGLMPSDAGDLNVGECTGAGWKLLYMHLNTDGTLRTKDDVGFAVEISAIPPSDHYKDPAEGDLIDFATSTPAKFKQWDIGKSDGTIRLKWGSGKLCVTEGYLREDGVGTNRCKKTDDHSCIAALYLEKCSGSEKQKFEFHSDGSIGSASYKGKCFVTLPHAGTGDTLKNVTRTAFPGQERGKGYIPPTSPVPMLNDSLVDFSSTPHAIDWSEKGLTTKIKDQGSCGCCWAFAATEGIESAAKHAGSPLEELSAAQICQCDSGAGGCGGGDPTSAFNYVHSKGLDSNSGDPYGGQEHQSHTEHCKWNGHVTATITGYKQVPRSENSLAAALAEHGPLTICINARVWPNVEGRSDWSWTGIAPWAHKCTNEQADHCVQLVGYDKTASKPYWKLRNQWGSTWGEHGYVRLPYGSDPCGIKQEAYVVEGATIARRRRSKPSHRRRPHLTTIV